MAERKHKTPTGPIAEPKGEVKQPSQGDANEEVITGYRESQAETHKNGLSQAEVDAIIEERDESRAKAKEYFEGWQRERADFSNYKRRIERDQAMLSQNITGEIIKKYLLVLDDLDRAMKMRPTDGEAAAWANGIELIHRKLQNILDAEGIRRIPAESEEFDPLRHEAISFEPNPDFASGQIIGVVQEGYTIGDRILRPARVRVAQ